MNKTIFPTEKPYIDEDGNWFLPTDKIWGGRSGLTAREDLCLMFLETDTSKCKDKKFIKKLSHNFCGSRTTMWRTKKRLTEKGYLY